MTTMNSDQPAMEPRHMALWLDSPSGSLRVRPAATPSPGPGEVTVRARAVAMNPIDNLPGIGRRIVLPWLTYPAVLGSDVAGDIIAIGPSVTGLRIGDRIVGYAAGVEKSRNHPAQSAFQTHVVLKERMCSPLPDTVAFQEAAVLPMAITTAAAGLFQTDQLALLPPTAAPTEPHQSVLIFGGATSVGMNAIQLARNAGYDVIATSSPRNAALLQRLGARAVVDYHDPDITDQIIQHLNGRLLAGTLAIVRGTLRHAITVNASKKLQGTKRVASAQPTPATKIQGALARRRGIRVSTIWGGSPNDNEVGPAIWNTFLPAALADGRYQTAPPPRVTGRGLDAIPDALAQLRKGVNAEKIVVTL